ncbi:MAG: outer membrane protein transport protein [Candidatus Thiodiazotropha sp.]
MIPAPIAAVLADTDTTAVVGLPASLSLSVTTEVAPNWELMADITWTQWSNFDELRIEFDNLLKSREQAAWPHPAIIDCTVLW